MRILPNLFFALLLLALTACSHQQNHDPAMYRIFQNDTDYYNFVHSHEWAFSLSYNSYGGHYLYASLSLDSYPDSLDTSDHFSLKLNNQDIPLYCSVNNGEFYLGIDYFEYPICTVDSCLVEFAYNDRILFQQKVAIPPNPEFIFPNNRERTSSFPLSFEWTLPHNSEFQVCSYWSYNSKTETISADYAWLVPVARSHTFTVPGEEGRWQYSVYEGSFIENQNVLLTQFGMASIPTILKNTSLPPGACVNSLLLSVPK